MSDGRVYGLRVGASIGGLLVGVLAFSPNRSEANPIGQTMSLSAIPQFARRYNLKCSACHTIVPVLNEQGWMFKRLGYHLPPALEQGKPAPTIADLVKKEPNWTLTNNAALAVTDVGYSSERTTVQGQPDSSTAGFQVAYWNAYFGGWLPDANFFYYAEFDIVSGGSTNPDLSNAYFGYSGGNARSSWYAAGGREHLQIGEGTRAAQVYSLLPNAPLLFETASPTNFVLDQSPVGIDLGYTWASSSYRNIFAATVKVINGDNADGSEILGPSAPNSQDVWFDLDYWYAPESGVSFVGYYGTKDNVQTDSLGNQFTFRPRLRRQGIFANYKLISLVDLLGGYVHSNDDWEAVQGGAISSFIGDDYYGAVDYYFAPGRAVSARYDGLRQQVTGPSGVGPQAQHAWTIGLNNTLTPSGNVVARIAYRDLSGRDPVSAIKRTSKLFQLDISLNF